MEYNELLSKIKEYLNRDVICNSLNGCQLYDALCLEMYDARYILDSNEVLKKINRNRKIKKYLVKNYGRNMQFKLAHFAYSNSNNHSSLLISACDSKKQNIQQWFIGKEFNSKELFYDESKKIVELICSECYKEIYCYFYYMERFCNKLNCSYDYDQFYDERSVYSKKLSYLYDDGFFKILFKIGNPKQRCEVTISMSDSINQMLFERNSLTHSSLKDLVEKNKTVLLSRIEIPIKDLNSSFEEIIKDAYNIDEEKQKVLKK